MPYPLVTQELACGRRSSWGPGKASRVWTAHTNSGSHVSSATFGQEELAVVDEGVSERDGGGVAAEVTGQGEGTLVVYCTSRPAEVLRDGERVDACGEGGEPAGHSERGAPWIPTWSRNHGEQSDIDDTGLIRASLTRDVIAQ